MTCIADDRPAAAHRYAIALEDAFERIRTMPEVGVLRSALYADLDVLAAGRRWYSGALLLETMPSALRILAGHADDPEEAIVRAVNDTRVFELIDRAVAYVDAAGTR